MEFTDDIDQFTIAKLASEFERPVIELTRQKQKAAREAQDLRILAKAGDRLNAEALETLSYQDWAQQKKAR